MSGANLEVQWIVCVDEERETLLRHLPRGGVREVTDGARISAHYQGMRESAQF
jgi:hypothetical protein